MKIECDKCSAKYSIADEKVRGKTFKIRCKKCSNVIIVRDKGVVAADAGAGSAAEQAGPGWHLAINGETVGPMPEDEVRQRFSAGEIDRDTAVWQEGFDDWLPLGDVDAFADLPERSDDPFAVSANQDDYAAGGGRVMGVGAAAAVAATGTDGPEHQSPRVSKLTGQRNENSVLFSLDSLQAMATSGAATAGGGGISSPAARAQANPSKGLATSAPSSEGSGLIDIRSLGSMVGGGGMAAASAAPQAAADDAALPSFGGGGFGGLAAAPLISPHAPVAEAAPVAVVQPRSNAPLYIMMVVLILAVGGLGAFIVLKKPPETQTIVQEVPVVAPSVKDDDEDDKKKKDDDEGDEKKDDDEKAAEAAGEGGSSGGSGGEEPEDDAKKSSGTKKSSGSSTKKSSGGSASSSNSGSSNSGSGSSTKTDAKKSSSDDSPSVDCILDPSKCGKPKKSSGGSSSGSSSGGSTKPGVPAKLSSTDIKKSMAAVKDSAKSCGSKHGAKAGEKVTVKISVSGGTGKVTKVTPQAPHASTALGNCVAAALKSASFNEFSEATMGFQYSVTM